jgi:hypothetical protein
MQFCLLYLIIENILNYVYSNVNFINEVQGKAIEFLILSNYSQSKSVFVHFDVSEGFRCLNFSEEKEGFFYHL